MVFLDSNYSKVEIHMIIHRLAARKIFILIFICMAPRIASTSDCSHKQETNSQKTTTETNVFGLLKKSTPITDLLELDTEKSTAPAHHHEPETIMLTISENLHRPPRALKIAKIELSNPATESMVQSLSQQLILQPNGAIECATAPSKVAMIAATFSIPACLAPITMDAIQLKSIFVLLYFFSIQIDFDSDYNGDFLYLQREPELCIYQALDTLDFVIKSNNTAFDIKKMMQLAFEAVQIFNLISYLPHESKMNSYLKSDAKPSKDLRSQALCISLDEELLISRLTEEYDPASMSFAARARYTSLDTQALINLCKKFMYKCLPILNAYPQSPYDDETSLQLARRYLAFKKSPQGTHKHKDIARSRAALHKDHPLHFKSADELTEFDDAENPRDLEGYHSARWMKAYIKRIKMMAAMSNFWCYPHIEILEFRTILARLSSHIYGRKEAMQSVELDELHAHVDGVVGFVEKLIKEQFKAWQP